MINKINTQTTFTSIMLSKDIEKRTMKEMEEVKKAEYVDFVFKSAEIPIEHVRKNLNDYTMAVMHTKKGTMLIGNDIRLEASVVHRLRDGKNALDPHAKLIDDFSPTLDIEA